MKRLNGMVVLFRLNVMIGLGGDIYIVSHLLFLSIFFMFMGEVAHVVAHVKGIWVEMV
jgi:hypothetical protein